MKTHTTNYINTFILVADDCPAMIGEIPPKKGNTISVASIQFEIIRINPYKYSSDDVIFMVHAYRNDLTENESLEARTELFSKGQACLRSSPLTKRYGWGIHFNEEGKVAMFGLESKEYQQFLNDPAIKKIKAMRSGKGKQAN